MSVGGVFSVVTGRESSILLIASTSLKTTDAVLNLYSFEKSFRVNASSAGTKSKRIELAISLKRKEQTRLPSIHPLAFPSSSDKIV